MDLNIEHCEDSLKLLAEQPTEKFLMSEWFRALETPEDEMVGASSWATAQRVWDAHPCNTACCFAGLIQMHRAQTKHEKNMLAGEFAGEYLGLTPAQRFALFAPRSYNTERVTKEMVAARLRRMMQTAVLPTE